MIDPFVGAFNHYPLRQKSELFFRELVHGRVRMMPTLSLSPHRRTHLEWVNCTMELDKELDTADSCRWIQ